MPRFMALLHESPAAFANLSQAEMRGVIEKYKAWRESLSRRTTVIGSQKLKDGEGRMLRAEKGGLRVTDGPYSETKEVVGGYFAFEAADYAAAVRLLEACPHLSYGGTIEVRQFDEVE